MGTKLIERALAEEVSGINPGPLAKWSVEDLHALIAEVDSYGQVEAAAIEKGYSESLFKPEYFLSRSGQRALDKARKEAHVDIMGKTAELCAAAMCWLPASELKRYEDDAAA